MQNFSRIIALVYLILALAVSYAMLLGAGFSATPSLLETALFAFVIILLNSSKKAFYFILLPLGCLYAFYTPVGITFGAPSYQYVASVIATDLQESKEFFHQIPLTNFIVCAFIFVSLFVLHFLRVRYNLQFQHNKLFLAVMAITVFFSTAPSTFITTGFNAIMKVKQEFTRLNDLTIESQWGQSQLSPNSHYDDYILVIGESARKDYHHAYGYPIENTPFMSQANGILIDGLTAGGTNTIASLKLMLTKPDTKQWEGQYGLSMIDLIKSAGIKTYWLSNHGRLGSFDTPISSLANKSDETFFLKSGDSFDKNSSDFALLPQFQQIIESPHRGKRFIVLHLYGSHPISCDRLTDYPKIFNDEAIEAKYSDVNCYISTIKKTDEILRQLHQQLTRQEQQTGRRFSMVYFADHGLAHQIDDKHIAIHNSSGKSKLHFDIPLFKISSDDTQRKHYAAFKSGLNFTDGIANWIGIRNDKLNTEIDLFSPTADKDDYGLQKIIDQIEAPLDPAVIIPTVK